MQFCLSLAKTKSLVGILFIA